MTAQPRPAVPAGESIVRDRAPRPGPLRPFGFPEIHRRSLSNGVPVLIAEMHHFPVVTLNALLEAGGVYEEERRAGVASLTAELLESGAGGRSAEEIADAVETLGVQVDAGVSWEVAHVGLTALRSRLEPASEIFADLLRRPSFPLAEVERLRAERLAEIVQRRAEPRALANEVMARWVFAPESPFARPLGGMADTVEALTRQDVLAFHATRYVPAGATVIVAGDLSADEALALAERCFGDWAGGRTEAPSTEVRPRNQHVQVVVVDRPGSVQSEVRIGHMGVARDTADYFPLIVMNTILGGAFSSRLNLNLRERHGFTYGASSGFTMRRRPGSFLVSTAVQTEVTAAAISEILRELNAIREAEVAPDELNDARNYLAGVFPLRLQTTDGVAARLAELAVYGLPEDYLDTYRQRVLDVAANDVLRAAREHLHPDAAVVLVVGDAARVREPLEALGLGSIEVVNPADLDSKPPSRPGIPLSPAEG